MRDFIVLMLHNIVDDPASVTLEEKVVQGKVTYTAYVAPEEIGKVLGKQGRIVESLRLLIKGVAMKDHRDVSLDIVVR